MAEDAITTEEVLVVVLEVEDAKVVLTVKEVVLHQEEMVEEMVVSEAIEIAQLQEEKAVLEAKEAVQLQKEKVDFQTEHQDVQKVLVIPQDQEDQEEANRFSLIFL